MVLACPGMFVAKQHYPPLADERHNEPCPTWYEPEQGVYFQPGMSLKQET
jgi:hypothetical protein